MANQPLSAALTIPISTGAVSPACRSLGISWAAAPAMIGMLNKKLNTAALSRSSCSARPAVIVAPDRGHTRHDGERLGDTDEDRIAPPHARKRPAGRRGEVDQPQQNAHDDECRRDQDGGSERLVGLSFEQHASDASRDRPDYEIGEPTLLRPLQRSRSNNHKGARQQAEPLGSKVPQEGDERADVQRDIEGQAGILPAEDPWREHEMGRATDGDELGQSLEEAENESLKRSHDVRLRVGALTTTGAGQMTLRPFRYTAPRTDPQSPLG